VTQNRSTHRQLPLSSLGVLSHYAILGLHPGASPLEIRRAYRDLSKRYHPDTTVLAPDIATARFQRLNEAYRILSSPERRSVYDLQIGYSPWPVSQPIRQEDQSPARLAYLDPTDRPLSAGEIFCLVLLVVTLGGCLLLVFLVAWLRGDSLGLVP
jgi:curved DNA-binding protein CbpA